MAIIRNTFGLLLPALAMAVDVFVTVVKVSEEGLWNWETNQARDDWGSIPFDSSLKCPKYQMLGTMQFTKNDCKRLQTGWELVTSVDPYYYKVQNNACDNANRALVQAYTDAGCTQQASITIREASQGSQDGIACGMGSISDKPGNYASCFCGGGTGAQTWANVIKLKGFGTRDVDGRYWYMGAANDLPNRAGKKTFFRKETGYFIFWCPKHNDWRVAHAENFEELQKDPQRCTAYARAPENKEITSSDYVIGGWMEWQTDKWVTPTNDASVGVELLEYQPPYYNDPNTVTMEGFLGMNQALNFDGVSKKFTKSAIMQNGKPTFWSDNLAFYAYYCPRDEAGNAIDRWLIAKKDTFCENANGKCRGMVRSKTGRDWTHPAIMKGWWEYTDTNKDEPWKNRPNAGVKALTTRLCPLGNTQQDIVQCSATVTAPSCTLDASGAFSLCPHLSTFALGLLMAILQIYK